MTDVWKNREMADYTALCAKLIEEKKRLRFVLQTIADQSFDRHAAGLATRTLATDVSVPLPSQQENTP